MTTLKDFKTPKLWRALAAEFLGTLFLVLLACGTGLPFSHQVDLLKIAIAAGFTIASIIQIFGPISGGHVNPAVTAAMLIAKKIDPLKAAMYIVAQCLGAICGSGLLYAITAPHARGSLGTNNLSNGTGIAQGVAVEFVMTMVFILVICSAVDDRNKTKNMAPLAVGLAVSTVHLFGIPYTGVSINPARSLGPAVITHHWQNHWIFWVGPLLGAVSGAGIYHYILSPTQGKAKPAAYLYKSEIQPMRPQTRKNSVFSVGDRSIDTDVESAVYINKACDPGQVDLPVAKASSRDVV